MTDDRGFTDHEHMDEVGLIHMNGRVYDPVIGRFLSADPYVQAPYNSQSYNRYSYGWNNPLSVTDPAGYCSGLWTCLTSLANSFAAAIGFGGAAASTIDAQVDYFCFVFSINMKLISSSDSFKRDSSWLYTCLTRYCC
nr:RHS repeat-associated core domain-containing protein [Alkalimarinus coralli]